MANIHMVAAKYLFDGQKVYQNKVLIIENGIVQRVADNNDINTPNSKYLGDGVITPGFIDLQLNGCGGVLFNSNISIEALKIMDQTCLQFGTTSFLPTLITADFELVKSALKVVEQWILKYGTSRGVIGIHLEGPFISKEKHGIHDERFIIKPTEQHLQYIATYANKFPIKMTIAPEMFHVKQIKYLHDAGVVLSVGHSSTIYETALQGINSGITSATHIFNAMSGLSGRNPGVVGAVLNNDIYASVITDLFHVDKANIELLHKIKGDKLYIVTDAMPCLGADIDEFYLSGKKIFVRDGKCVDENGVLGGANISISDSIKNCMNYCSIPLEDALKMAVSTPAKVMGLYDNLVKIVDVPANKLVYMDLDNFNCDTIYQN